MPEEALKILVVEDDAPLRDAVCLTLEVAGHEVVGVGDGPVGRFRGHRTDATTAARRIRGASASLLAVGQRVFGLLVTPIGDDLSRLHALRRRGTPVILVDRDGTGTPFDSVAVDDIAGGRLAVGGPARRRPCRRRPAGAR